MALSAAILISVISNEDNAMKPWKVAVPGIIFLLSIGSFLLLGQLHLPPKK
jgi:hypothetical protein